MTIKEKRAKLKQYCNRQDTCRNCKCEYDPYEACYSGSDEHMLKNYQRVFGAENDTKNPYWDHICALSERQRAKGIETYGHGLENNPAAMLKRIEHLQEELIDGLMYCEWIKDKLTELEGKSNDQV